uniref:Glutaminase n=1 Tax=Ascaris lumbricoides TaxID=6252 RepID=A0A0M3HNB1_ASCLU
MAFINQDRLVHTASHSDAQFDGDVEMEEDGACEFDEADGGPHERSDFECFMYYATSPSIGDTNKIFVCVCLSAVFREVAVRSVAKTMHTLDPDSDRRRLERLMRAVESIFERDDVAVHYCTVELGLGIVIGVAPPVQCFLQTRKFGALCLNKYQQFTWISRIGMQ